MVTSSEFFSKIPLRLRMAFWRIVYRGYAKRYKISPSFRFNGVAILLSGDGIINLDADSYIGDLSTIQSCTGHAVHIGRRCMIAHNVRIYTETADPETDFRRNDGLLIRGNVNIEDGVWIGVNVYISPGVTIGSNSVIGANSVVTASVPANEIWGGVPARLIRRKIGEASTHE
jgi:maltose O-acetyltransferase